MANDDPPLPGFSGTGDSLYGSFRRERAQKLGGFKRESVKIGTGGSGFFSGGVFSSGGMRLQLGVALTLSIAAGSVAGVILGGNTGVKPGLEAGSRLDAAMLAPNGPPNANAAAQTDPTPEMARMLDEMRGLRAQIEQLRHGVETARTADRSRAQETARDASLEARQQALDQTTAKARRDRFAAGPAGALRRRYDARRLDRQARARREWRCGTRPKSSIKASPGAADTRLSHLLAMC